MGIGEIVGGIILYALLGTIANMVFSASITFMNAVMLEGGGILSQFNFLNNNDAGKTTLAVLQGSSATNTLVSVMWIAGWAFYGISAGLEIFKLIRNGSRNTSGAWIKTVLRLMIVGTLLMQWYPILDGILGLLNNLVSNALSVYGQSLPKQQNVFSILTGDGTIVSIKDINQAPTDYILLVIVAFSLGTSLFSCTIAYLERFISFAIYCYISPIAVGLAANEDSQSTLKDWIMGLFPQVLGLVVCAALMVLGFSVIQDEFKTNPSTILQCAIATVFFSQARHVEEFFNMLGFKTMRATDAATSALSGMALASRFIGKSTGSIAKGATKGAGYAMNKFSEQHPNNLVSKLYNHDTGIGRTNGGGGSGNGGGTSNSRGGGGSVTSGNANYNPKKTSENTQAAQTAFDQRLQSEHDHPEDPKGAIDQYAVAMGRTNVITDSDGLRPSDVGNPESPVTGEMFQGVYKNSDNLTYTDDNGNSHEVGSEEFKNIDPRGKVTGHHNGDGNMTYNIPLNGGGRIEVTKTGNPQSETSIVNDNSSPQPTGGNGGGAGAPVPSGNSYEGSDPDAAQPFNLKKMDLGGNPITFTAFDDSDTPIKPQAQSQPEQSRPQPKAQSQSQSQLKQQPRTTTQGGPKKSTRRHNGGSGRPKKGNTSSKPPGNR